MSRRKSARRVRQERFIRSIIGILLIVTCLILVFIGKTIYKNNTDVRVISYGYSCPETILTMDAKAAIHESPGLFAENLAVVTSDADSDEKVSSPVGITVNRTKGTVKFSKNSLVHRYPASVTKTMTFLTALRYGDLEDSITIESRMLANLDPDSSVAGLRAGDTLTLEQLLYGLMLPSGNDAANAIAYLVGGSEEGFVELMNKTALEIGATGSHFVNAHGLNDEDHYTTCYDIYLIYNELMRYHTFYDVIEATDYRTWYDNNGSTVENFWARGIWYFTGQAQAPEGVFPIGGKTGTTPEAGYCLSLASKDAGGDEYVSVVFGAKSRNALYESMTALLSKITE